MDLVLFLYRRQVTGTPMGASVPLLSKELQPQRQVIPQIDEIITVFERNEAVDPLLERVGALEIARPLLNSPPPTEPGLSDILVRKPSSSSSLISSYHVLESDGSVRDFFYVP